MTGVQTCALPIYSLKFSFVYNFINRSCSLYSDNFTVFYSGEVSAASGLSLSAADNIKSKQYSTKHWLLNKGVYFLMNNRSQTLQDARVRRALRYTLRSDVRSGTASESRRRARSQARLQSRNCPNKARIHEGKEILWEEKKLC